MKTSVNKIKYVLLISIACLFTTTSIKAQLPTAQEIACEMKVGWNLGNTLEAICSETAWGGAVTTQKLIDSVKAAGFNAVRIPVAWYCHADTINNVIDADWIARVKEVVDYCINDTLYVIINIHWDSGWLENHIDEASQVRVNERQRAFWVQIADYFKDYDEHLMFASANEPNVEDAEGMAVLMTYHQTFVDVVRASGGNNASRTLIIQGPSTDIEKTNNLMDSLPVDVIDDRLIAEVHYYTPYQFCLMTEDAGWGNMFYYWGQDYHSSTEPDRNASWGEEDTVDEFFGLMKSKFVDNGVPVIIGEFGAYKKDLPEGSDQDLHNASVEYYLRYCAKKAIDNGLIPFYWATNKSIFNRSECKVVDRGVLNALIQGASEGNYPISLPTQDSLIISVHPNPSTSVFTMEIDKPELVNGISIYDINGNKITDIENSKIDSVIEFGAGLEPNIYLVLVSEKTRAYLLRIEKR